MKPLIPDEALDKHVALLGMTGAGKSSVIRAAIVEPDLEADRRVIIVTPKDDWWGLRLSKTGKSKGFDIPIFGGWHGDYPLNVKDAALLAEAYATMKGSAIFVTSRLSVQDRARWFSAFAETILSKNKGWARLVIDEAHVFMPKQGGKGGGAIPAALHAGNELVSQGRSLGLRIVLASQRSAKLHNDALTQCSCLIAMLLMAPHDRDAVKDWIEDQADPVKGKEIVASLANLEAGQAWVWAPRAKMLEKIQFPMPLTFDSSAAPDDGAADGPQLTPINLDALKGKLATVEAEKKANDPKELKAEIAKLKAALKNAPTNITEKVTADPKAEERGFGRGVKETKAEAKKMAHDMAVDTVASIQADVRPLIDAVNNFNAAISNRLKELSRSRPMAAVEFTPSVMAPPRSTPIARPTKPPVAAPIQARQNGDGSLSKGERVILTAAAQYPEGVTREQLTVMTSYKRSSRDTYLQRIFSNGFAVTSGDRILASAEGIAALGDFTPLPTGDALRSYWLSKLGGGEQAILNFLCEAYPDPVERDAISDATEYKRSSRDTYLQRLAARQLIEIPTSGTVKASPMLFG